MGEFVFDARVFIQPPYITSPNCGTENAFGVLMIGWGYTPQLRRPSASSTASSSDSACPSASAVS